MIRWHKRCLAVTASLAVAVGVISTEPAVSADDEDFRLPFEISNNGTLDQQVAQRESLGLTSDRDFVRSVMDDPNSTTDLGLSLSPDEDIELRRRMVFQTQVLDDVLPLLESADGFGGAYFDSESDGRLVVYANKPITAELQSIRDSLPDLDLPVHFIEVDIDLQDVYAAVDRVAGGWADVIGDQVRFISVGSDDRALGVVVEVAAADLATARAASHELEALIAPIPLTVQAGEPDFDAVCTSRENCYSPFRGGIAIRKGSTSGGRCTMAWHVRVGSDRQFLTAGHCSYTGSINWYHQGNGFIGARTATMYPGAGVDAMRVQMADGQASQLVYGYAGNVTTSGWPVVGTYIYASLGVSNIVWNDMVTSSYHTWTSSTCGCTVSGGRATISAVGGDSGSPILSIGGQAWGILSTTGGRFARVQDVLNYFAISLN
jgi:hypothetical protein